MSKQKEVTEFIVVKRGGLQNGRTVRTSGVYRVGARNPKEAIDLCKQQIDKTGGYHVRRNHVNRKLRLGTVVPLSGIEDPFVEINGEIYIRTDDVKESHETVTEKDGSTTSFPVLLQKFVKRYAKGEKDVLWL